MRRSHIPGFRPCFAAALALLFAPGPAARAKPLRAAEPVRSVARPAPSRAIDGRVVEVRRASRELTVRTSRGEIEHVVVTATSAIHAPHGTTALSGIHAGMPVHAEVEVDSHRRLVARTISAR